MVGICRLLPNIISSRSWLISSCKKRWTCELSLPPYKHLAATMFVTFLTDVLDPRLFSELKVKPFLQKYIHFFYRSLCSFSNIFSFSLSFAGKIKLSLSLNKVVYCLKNHFLYDKQSIFSYKYICDIFNIFCNISKLELSSLN